MMKQSIYPCLWFDGNAQEAADLYCSVFGNAKMLTQSPMVVQFEIEGKKIMGLNGGPMFKINPSISLFVTCQTNEEIEGIWNKLIEGGKALMPLDKYPWNEKYGWLADKYGMTWQLKLGEMPAGGQKINPSFLFVGEQYGKAAQAVKDYTSLFPNSQTHHLQLYGAGQPQPEGNLMYAEFSLQGELFSAMDGWGKHEYAFNEGVSIVVECETQEEIDLYWDTLTKEGKESMCGWLSDKYGVSWQVIPNIIGSLMTDPARSGNVMQAILKMRKLDIATLLNA